MTLFADSVCVYKVLLVYTLLSARMAKHNPKKVYSKIFTYFLQNHFPLFWRELTWEKKKNIDKLAISGSYHHCQIIFSEPLVKCYI